MLGAFAEAVLRNRHLLLAPAAIWLLVGWALARHRRRARGFGLAGGFTVLLALGWLAAWWWEAETVAPRPGHLLSLSIELFFLTAVNVVGGVIVWGVALLADRQAGTAGGRQP